MKKLRGYTRSYSPGLIVTPGKEKEFFKKLNDNRIDIYKLLNENEKIRRNCTKENLDAMDAFIDRQERIHG